MKDKKTDTVITVLGTGTGIAASRVLADKIPVKNAKLKHGLLAIAGVAGAMVLNSKDSTEAFFKNASAGLAGAEFIALVKEFIGEPKNATVKTALGNPYATNFLGNSAYDFTPSGFVQTTDDVVEYEEGYSNINFAG